MNPVSFYFCYERDSLKYIVAEINNTPWDERHSYVLDATGEAVDHSNGRFDFEFDKDFHVSPFMPMDIKYHWRFSFNGKKLVVHMNLTREGEKVFDATMHGRQESLSANNMRMLPIEYPFQTVLVGVRIYWHALLLWLKRVPFLTHPDKLSDSVKSGERS